MAEKDKDLFLDMLENPNLTLEDMISVGHNSQTTRFLDKSVYENSQRVRNKFMDDEGNFKQNEFDEWYKAAAKAYQTITDKDTNLSLLNVTAFNESDITVDPSKRTLNTAPIVSFSPNPDRLSASLYQIGKTTQRERTQSELAQAEKVLLNPVEAAKDPSKAKWGDSPNDSWWGNFFDTQVLAQWDEDGEHIDSVTKQKVTHKKGDYKLNDNGTYYYESLDGRDIYGRQVLNKMNTITTDGSFWNLYDFFDSDDIKEKSFVGSVAKNLALVGSMFIPYVGWGIAGASIAVQTAGLVGTLGKMLTGSDSPTFSAMEGWAKSLNRQGAKSEYAQQNMLCWENFIDLIGDTTAQLREQRALFKFAPAMLGKGKYGIESKHLGANTATLKAEKAAALRKASNANMDLGRVAQVVGEGNVATGVARIESMRENLIMSMVDREIKNYFEDYTKLGEQLSRAYMIGLTVGDTYGEAKEAGASDFEAAMLTIGYAAAENKLLKSELGRWIFPELKAEKATMRQITKKAIEAPAEVGQHSIENALRSSGASVTRAELLGKKIAGMSQETKQADKILGKLDDLGKTAWMKKWFNAGKDVFNQQSAILKGTGGAMLSNALAEGVEEVSEELLKDFSTSCFNLVKAAQGDKTTRMTGFLGNWDWNEALKRYGMSFFGGIIGGGINSAAVDYSQFKNIANMSSESAIQLLVWMDRNNEMDKFWDVVNKQTLGDKYHSTEQNADGTFKLAKEDGSDSQDAAAKRAIREQINLIHNVLHAEGASIDDEGLIGVVMDSLPGANREELLSDFRAQALATSTTAGRFLKLYNDLCKSIVIESLNLKKLTDSIPDSGKPSESLLLEINESKNALNDLKKAKDDLFTGKRALEFYRDALFETTYGVSEGFISPTEVQYAERLYNKPYTLLTKEEKENASKRYVEWSKTERSEQIHALAEIFYDLTSRTSQALQNSADTYEKLKLGQLQNILKIDEYSRKKLIALTDILNYDENPVEEIQKLLLGVAHKEDGHKAEPLGFNPGAFGIELEEGSLTDVLLLLGNKDNQYVEKINAISTNETLTTSQKVAAMTLIFVENISKGLTDTAQEIIDAGFIHPEVKQNLLPNLKNLKTYIETITQDVDDLAYNESNGDVADELTLQLTSLQEQSDLLEKQIGEIEALSYTPIVDNLKSFGVSLGVNKSVLSLLEDAINKEESYMSAVDNIILDDVEQELFELAEKLLTLYRASIIASLVDNADVENIFGYNKTLNEIMKGAEGYRPLAEIDKNTAQLAVEDINKAMNRLIAIKGISDLNLGNKLNTLHYAAANKSFILYNKMHKLLSSLNDTDDDDAKELRANWKGLDELQAVIDSMQKHESFTAEKAVDRKLSLSAQDKEDVERELHAMDNAIYAFFLKNLDKLANTEEATQLLAKFLKAAKLDYYDKNEGILSHTSDDIDDGAFTWWLASKAALKASDFYNVYRNVITDKIAPIPTLELGIYAAVASIYNGNIFSAFGKAMKQYIRDDWFSKTDILYDENGKKLAKQNSLKFDIILAKGLKQYLPETNTDIDELNYSDLVPSFYNILFIEGIPGAGKSTGTFKTIVSILNQKNPVVDTINGEEIHLLLKGVAVVHTSKEKGEILAKSLEFKDGTVVSTYGKKDFLESLSADYKDTWNEEELKFIYRLGEDVILGDDKNLHSTWKVRQLDPKDVPAVIFIDEWSKYTQPEVDLINRYASEYGVTVITGGDLDQVTPKAYLLLNKDSKIDDKDTLILTNARSITPRIPKLGISMRSGNGLKVVNLYTLQSWKRNKTADPINLLYVEDDKDIYGDKVYNVRPELTDKDVANIQKDVDKLIANLKENEKIGYIFHDEKSKLYQLLTSDKYKDKIIAASVEDAHGDEARYYVVEGNRSPRQDEDDCFEAFYTGISRAEQASISIVPNESIGKLKIKNPENQENKLIPDSFTKEGIARFSKQRKAVLDAIYKDAEKPDLSRAVTRDKLPIELNPVPTNADGNLKDDNQNNNEDPKGNKPAVPQAQFKLNDVITNGTDTFTILDVNNRDGKIFYKVESADGSRIEKEEDFFTLDGFLIKPPTNPPPTNPSPEPSNDYGDDTDNNAPTDSLSSQDDDTKPADDDEDVLSIDNAQSVIDAIKNTGISDLLGGYTFDLKTIANALGTKVDSLKDIMNTFINDGIIEETNATGRYVLYPDRLSLDVIEEEPEQAPTEPPTPKYKVGDQVTFKNKDYLITDVEVDPQTQEVKYKLKSGRKNLTLTLESIEKLDEKGKVSYKEDINTPGGTNVQPLNSTSTFGQASTLKLLEEMMAEDSPVTVEIEQGNDEDIIFPILGYTWNTNYLGTRVEDGNVVLPQKGERGYYRVDNANGLAKLDPIRFRSADACRRVLGLIRRSALNDSNEDITKVIKSVIPSLRNTNLKVKWAFISKSKEHKKDDGGPFFYDKNLKLDYMEDVEHAEMPIKTISLLIGDGVDSQGGNCILEIPLLTLNSPFTALYKLGLKYPENPIAKAYNSAADIPGINEQEILQSVIKAIEGSGETKNEKGLKPGYARLADLCRLWQFTSDGIRFIPNMEKGINGKRGVPFNLAAHAINTGSHYIKNRITERTIRIGSSPYDYEMNWHELDKEAQRQDCVFSSVMLAPQEKDRNLNRIVAAGHPFVLRSTSNEFTTDSAMMTRYIEQLNDKSLAPVVTLIPVSTPEIPVSDYLINRKNLLANNTGNQFTAYRILSAIKREDPKLFRSINKFGEIGALIDALDAVKPNPQPGLNHLQVMSDVYVRQKQIMGDDGVKKLSKALFELTWNFNGTDTDTHPVEENINAIQEICNRINPETNLKYLTGVLYRAICRKNESPVAGFALLIETQSDRGAGKYQIPGGAPFRIYSRYDTPVFDLTRALTPLINKWAGEATQGIEGRNGHNYDNVWTFQGGYDYAERFYKSRGKTKNAATKTPTLKLKEKHANLLEKLGLKDYDKLAGVSDEIRFLEIIRDRYIETPGNVAVIVNGNLMFYTRLDNVGVYGLEQFPEEFVNATLESFVSNNAGDNSYTLTLKSGDKTLEINVTISPGNSEMIFDLGKPEVPTVVLPTADFSSSLEIIEKLLPQAIKSKSKLKDILNEFKTILNNANGKSLDEIKAELSAVLPANMAATALKRVFGQDFSNLQAQDAATNVAELQQAEVCSIKVHKKFIK